MNKVYELKQAFCEWFNQAKSQADMSMIEEGLFKFYKQAETSGIPAVNRAIQNFKNWQKEILNSFSFGYSNCFLESINNKIKVMKRNVYGLSRTFNGHLNNKRNLCTLENPNVILLLVK